MVFGDGAAVGPRVSGLAGFCLAALVLGANSVEAADQPPPASPLPVEPAAPAEQPNKYAAGIGIGTLGLGAEFSARVTEWMVLRLDGGGYAFSVTHELQDNSFSLQASLISAALIADWHLFSNGFRLSAGPTFQDFQATGSALVANGSTVTINGTPYSTSEIGSLHARITDNKVGGYFGIGYDVIHFAPGRFRISFDLGGIYVGAPKIDLTTDKSVPGLADNLQAEEQTIESSLKYLSVYPVLTITAKYSF